LIFASLILKYEHIRIRPARNAYRDLVGKPYGKHLFPRIGHTGNAYGIAMGRPLIKDLLPVIVQPKNVY
jgi:hypothetical protein